ncbi:hypothetical protein [Dictyobacter formicarum]|uniref:hypothetical protein n=1 Tax=Dictyobacter formicarum TaxID=2778368 RepID=UPI001915B0DB|nr:hypothetical protein [Dictyobacter formicarum]
MELPASHSEQRSTSYAFAFQRICLASCIILAPLSITLYLVTWEGNLRDPLAASAVASSTGNILHLIGGMAASFFLPLGYLGMSLLGMRRAPWLATLSAALSLVGWIPWAALMGLDDLAYDICPGWQHQSVLSALVALQRRPLHDDLPAHLYHRSSAQRHTYRFYAGSATYYPCLDRLGLCPLQPAHHPRLSRAQQRLSGRSQIPDLCSFDYWRHPICPGHAQKQK